MYKHWYQSRTIQIAIAQGVLGIIIAFEANDPSFKALGVGAIAKTLIDVLIRISTYTEIGKPE